jgi:hypothetical protein
VCAGNRSKNGDNHDKDGACRNCIAKKGDCLVTASKPFGHDAGADYSRNQDGRAQTFREQPPT